MSTEKRVRAAMAHAAVITLAGEIIDDLKGTSLYRQADKRKLNSVAEMIQMHERNHINSGFYDDGYIEQQFQTMQKIIDSFKEALIHGPAEHLHLLVNGHENFTKGNFIEEPDNANIDLHTKSLVAKDTKKVISAMRAKGYRSSEIKGYLMDLVDKTETEQIKQSA